jgi:hypothetical protein
MWLPIFTIEVLRTFLRNQEENRRQAIPSMELAIFSFAQ